MRIVSIVNQKGGCGKTTTAINLAGVFARDGRRTLLVDMDPQGHCAAGLAIPEGRIDLHIGDAMLLANPGMIDRDRLLWRVSRNLDLAPSTVKLAALEASRGPLSGQADAEKRLGSFLSTVRADYDLCLIDCSPAIGMLAFNALVAADLVLIPVETGFFSLQGATKQAGTIQAVAKKLGASPMYRFVATMHDPASALACDLLEELRRRFSGRVSPVVIRSDSALKEASSFGQPVIEYDPESTGAADYRSLAAWLESQFAGIKATNETEFIIDPPPAGPTRVASTIERKPGTVTAAREFREADEPVSEASVDSDGLGAAGAAVTRVADVAARAKRLRHPTLLEVVDEDGLAPPPTSVAEAMARAASVANVVGVRCTPQGVLFVQPGIVGRSVCIAGDFNGWSATAKPMRLNRSLGVWEACVNLPPGVHQYRMVIDGRWVADAFNPETMPNPFGGVNSVIRVGE